MAPKFIIRITITSLVLALFTTILPTPALAASSADISPFKEHIVKFYLDPALVPDLEYAKIVLSKYISDMNTILEKNTNRRLIFDPETNIIATSTKPQTDSAKSPLATQGFEIWVYAVRTDGQISYGGYAGMDISGAGVLAGLKWTRLYDPDNLDATNVFDYSIQLNNMLHELAHVFGAGIGEYYNLANIIDTTNAVPSLNIKLGDPQDAFWSDKPDFMSDPLLKLTRASTRSEYLGAVQYSNLTAAIINGDYRNGIPSFDHFTVQVLDENDQPLPEANVQVWSIYNTSELLHDAMTDENGLVDLAWGGSGSPHIASNFLRLVKVYKDNIPVAQPRYISIFDSDIAQLVMQSDLYMVTFRATPIQPESSDNNIDVFNAIGNQDGWILESNEASNKGGSMNYQATKLNIGDDTANKQYIAILSFDTSSIPDNAVITAVTLKVKYAGISGTLPFKTHGKLLADIPNGSFSNNPAIQLGDFIATVGKKAVLAFTNNKVDNWYSQSFNSTDFQYINLLSDITQFRLRFAKDDNNDSGADYLKIYSGNAPLTYRPQLIITWHLP
jgi:hypothetical protein